MANQNSEIQDLIYVRKIIAFQQTDPQTGEKILKPEGYENATIKENSLWFIQKE